MRRVQGRTRSGELKQRHSASANMRAYSAEHGEVRQIVFTLAISESDEEGVGFGWVELNVRDVSGKLDGRIG